MSVTIRTNCPRDCYDGCGIVVTLEDGKKPRVAGDPDHPVAKGTLCGKCGVAYNGVFQDEDVRLSTPLRRTGPKGKGEFEPISWDEALGEIATNFKRAIAEKGPESILTMGYSGTLSMLGFFFPARLVNFMGASVVEYGTTCNVAGEIAWKLQFGSHDKGFDPRTAKDSSCILLWGANPSHSAPHMHKHWLNDSPAKVVVVDPIRTETAEAADLHLQPRPGTDAALAFGILHAISELDAFDDSFVAEHTVGFDEISSDIAECTPEWTEQHTGVTAGDIRQAAKIYSAGPALLWAGQGLQRQPQGGNIMRAVGLLPAVTGNVGKAGAGFYYLNDPPAFAGADYDYLMGAELAKGNATRVGALDLADRLSDPEEFSAFMVWNSNPLASCSDQQKLRAAVSRDDLFVVSIELFETDTARFADIVLPAASFLEFDDLMYSYMNLNIGAQSKVREPIGESLPNQEIFRRIAIAMGYDEPALLETDESCIAAILQQMEAGFDFEELKKRGYYPLSEEPMIFYEDLKFETPSGHIEIASDEAAEMGLPRTAVPSFDAPPPENLLRLISPASKWRMNDSYANDKRLAIRAGEADIILCAADADRLGLKDATDVDVSNDAGSIRLKLTIDDIVQPGTAVSYKGRWPSRESGGENINFIHKGEKCDMGEATSVHGILVSVVAAQVEGPA